jgi:hypothetical protein
VIATQNKAAAAAVAAKDKADEEKRKQVENARFQSAVWAAITVRESMKNPDSFRLKQTLRKADGSLCFSYRATNSFNAIITGHAVYASGKLAISGNPQFATHWAKYCSGKSGDDLDTIAYSL